jgi:prolyl-tRNA editing enzyme YbaK/EbsC (Cys-tRNA(Pro) deacylase)
MGDMAPSTNLPGFDGLTSLPVLEHLDLVPTPVADLLRGWARAADVAVVEIDPDLADTAALTEAYGLPLEASANCVLISGSRGGEERIAACVVAADTRADVNNVARKLIDVRKASFLPMDRAVEESGMEYGGITPVGLPASWRLLVDAALLGVPAAMIGSGLRRSKLILPGDALAQIPGAEVVEGLGKPVGG